MKLTKATYQDHLADPAAARVGWLVGRWGLPNAVPFLLRRGVIRLVFLVFSIGFPNENI